VEFSSKSGSFVMYHALYSMDLDRHNSSNMQSLLAPLVIREEMKRGHMTFFDPE